MNTIITRILITGALLFATSAFAADSMPEPARSPEKLDAVRAQIAAKNFPGAIDELKRLNDSGDADWNNLMGYSLRKAATPDSRAPRSSTTKRCASTPGTAARSNTRASSTCRRAISPGPSSAWPRSTRRAGSGVRNTAT